MNADDLARRIVVRHREAGYLRLELPPALSRPAAVAAIEVALRELPGVYRVAFYAAQRRLVVSFDAHVCTVAAVARTLKAKQAASIMRHQSSAGFLHDLKVEIMHTSLIQNHVRHV